MRATFATLVAPMLLTGWLVYMWAAIALMAAKLVIALVPGWRSAVPRGFSRALGQASAFLCCIGIIVSPWILMPRADDPLSLLMIVLCMWFTAMVIILNNDRLSVAGAVAVALSMAVFILVHRLPYTLPLAGFLVMEAIALVMLRRMIWRSNDTLAVALELTKTERDAKTRFIAAASHDLQQPLQAARLYFDQAVNGTDAAHRAAAIKGAHKALSSTAALLEGMLEHLRLETGAMPVRPAALHLSDVFAAAAMEHAPSLQAADITLKLAGGRYSVRADARLLARIVGNLVGNAARHSRGARLLLAARRRGDDAEIWVIDDGEGIAPADTGKLFDDYFQSSRDGSTAGGFGLGLASARRMAELMDGTLTLEPRWRAGAAFVLRLPLAEDRA